MVQLEKKERGERGRREKGEGRREVGKYPDGRICKVENRAPERCAVWVCSSNEEVASLERRGDIPQRRLCRCIAALPTPDREVVAAL